MIRWLMLALIKGYKKAIAPFIPASCRYLPTCSEYALQAIEKYGAIKGGWMAAKRLARCNPFVEGGYDPVK